MPYSTPTASDNPNTHTADDNSDSPGKEPNKRTAHQPAGMANIPAEIVLKILGNLGAKKDWAGLARTCRRVSGFVVAELDKYTVEDGDYYALWYACVANNPAILLHHIALDPAVVNRHFTRDFRRKRVERVKLHSKWRFYPDLRVFGDGMTPLAVAITAGNHDIVQLLLANGADPNRSDSRRVFSNCVPWYPIHWAVASKHESAVATIRLLGAHSANMDQIPADCKQHIATYPKGMKCAPIFVLLMLQKPMWDSRGTRQTSCEEFNDDLRQLQGLRLQQLEALLQCGADPNVRYGWDSVTPVFFLLSNLATYSPSFYFDKSATLSHEEDAQAGVVNEIAMSFLDTLCNFGADIPRLGNAYFHHDTVVHRLAAAYPETPLHVACRLPDRHKPIMNWFLFNGLPIDSVGRAQGTPLMAYCGSDFTDVGLFREFLHNGPTINHTDIVGRTALHELCANQRLRPQVREKAVRMLLDRGADPTFLSNKGHSPAAELDPDPKKREAHKDVLAMLKAATRAWNRRARKLEEQERKRNEPPAPSRPPQTQDNRAKTQRSDRGRQGANHGNDRQENRKGGYGAKKIDRSTGSPVGRQGQHATAQGSNGGNRKGNRRGNKNSLPDSTHTSTQHSNGNRGDGQGKGKDAFPKRRNNRGDSQERDKSTARDTVYSSCSQW